MFAQVGVDPVALFDAALPEMQPALSPSLLDQAPMPRSQDPCSFASRRQAVHAYD
ncbi:hypothetical protein WME99_28665 [Sorangium sp. So ce136]|uniref:hypothetical protein n=1 Tax=Sorangium sp. So ce136 TaxID=3133284 RepID=UPI003F10E74A